MSNPDDNAPQTGQLTWLLVQAWVIAVLAFSTLFALVFVLDLGSSIPTSREGNSIVTFVLATIFMFLSTILFSFPMMVISGMLAYLFYTPITRHPWLVVALWSTLGFILFRFALFKFGEISGISLLAWIFGYAITAEGIATLASLIISSSYFCLRLRKKMAEIK